MVSYELVILVLFAACLGAFGQVAFKLGSNKISKNWKNYFFNLFLWLGLFLYGLSTLIFIITLKFGDLTVLYPIVGSSYIWAVILAKVYLKEEINKFKLFGVIFIILGIIFITF